jgi:hypothetical protein
MPHCVRSCNHWPISLKPSLWPRSALSHRVVALPLLVLRIGVAGESEYTVDKDAVGDTAGTVVTELRSPGTTVGTVVTC